MTPAEYDAIAALHKEVSEGFREVRGLMEARRIEDVGSHSVLDERLRGVEQTAHTTRVIAYGSLVFAAAVIGGLLYLVHY